MEGTSDVTAEGALANWHIESKGYNLSVLPKKLIKTWHEQVIRDANIDNRIVIFVKLTRQDFFCIVPHNSCSATVKFNATDVTSKGMEELGFNTIHKAAHALHINIDISTLRYIGSEAEELYFMTPEMFVQMIS